MNLKFKTWDWRIFNRSKLREKTDSSGNTFLEMASRGSGTEEAYRLYTPISESINKIAKDCSRLLPILQSVDGVNITDKNVLIKYQAFLHDKFGQNGISSSVSALIRQIVSSLKMNNEYFLRVYYDTKKDMFLGIEVIPSSICEEEYSSEDGYIEKFEVLFSAKNINKTQVFKRDTSRFKVRKASVYKEVTQVNDDERENKAQIETYLLHYHSTNGINIEDIDFSDQRISWMPKLRGVSDITLIEAPLQIYAQLTEAIKVLTSLDEIKRHTAVAIVNQEKEKASVHDAFAQKKHLESLVLTPERNGTPVGFNYISKNINAEKDLVHYYNMRESEYQNILRFYGIPTRIISTAGSAYNNLAIATDEYERNILGIVSTIVDFLTKCMSHISTSFANNEYKIVIDKDTSFLLKKETVDSIEHAKEFKTLNEIREENYDLEPLAGGDSLPSAQNSQKELRPEEAIKQKRKMPHTGDRVVKKTT